MQEKIHLQTTIPEQYSGKRLDQALAMLFTTYSRERLKAWILSGECLVNDKKKQPKDKILGGENIEINANIEITTKWQAENLSLNIVYEDQDIIVVNKPANLVVHPANGNLTGTLVNALLHHDPELNKIPRAGIVHRLDKDTTGLMVIAKNLNAHNNLIKQLKKRTINRTYVAIINGTLIAGGSICEPIGRHHKDRKKMAVIGSGKQAITHYRIIEKLNNYTYIRIQLETGRTHQIRVHMAYIKHSIVGDKTYGGRRHLPKGASLTLQNMLRTFPRQALHASRLELQHPTSGKLVYWEVSLPADMQQLLDVLQK